MGLMGLYGSVDDGLLLCKSTEYGLTAYVVWRIIVRQSPVNRMDPLSYMHAS
jgi:hypothetical protein